MATHLEKRLAALEQEVTKLKEKIEGTAAQPWWERIAGTFQDDTIYKKAMKLGRQYRESLKSEKSRGNGKAKDASA